MSRLFTILLTILALLQPTYPNQVQGQAQGIDDNVIQSVVLLKSAVRNYCASGVLLNSGQIITANHVAQELCKRGQCHNLVVGISTKDSTDPIEHTGVVYHISSSYHGLDLALLSPGNNLTEQATNSTPQGFFSLDDLHDYKLDPNVTIASYPKCEKLTITSGIITKETTLNIDTTIEGAPGSSGGAILSNGKLVGIVTRGVSELDSAWGKIFNSPFPLQGIRLNQHELTQPHSDRSLLAQVSRFIQYYRNEVISATDPQLRKWNSLKLINAINGFVYQLTRTASLDSGRFRALMLKDFYPGQVLDYILTRPTEEKIDQFLQHCELLTLIATSEAKGLKNNLTTSLNVQDYITLLERAERADLKEHLLLIEKSNYPGTEALWLSTGVWIIIITIPLLLVFGWTMGYVWATAPKGRRIIYTLVVALMLWPISFLVYIFRPKQKKATPNPL